MREKFDYAVKSVRVMDLTPQHVMVGESGGLSAVYDCFPSIVMKDCMVVETEHGSLYLESDDMVDVLDRKVY